MNITSVIAKELNLSENQVAQVQSLLAEAATIPFIARYRKERTGGLDEEQLRAIQDRLEYLQMLEERKATVLSSIEEQGKLTAELKAKIEAANKLQEVEDLYLPYKPKRKTRGSVAKERGLEPLADFMLENPEFTGNFEQKLAEFVSEEKGVNSTDEALQGAKDIIAERISDTAEVRQIVRENLHKKSVIISKKSNVKPEDIPAGKKDVYENYHEFRIDINSIKPYQILAINRGERERFLKVSLDYDTAEILEKTYSQFFGMGNSTFTEIFADVNTDAFNRLISPSLEREVRNSLSELADEHAIEVFGSNLKQLLLQPPISGKIIMGIDPGFVSGSKVAVIDATGKYLEGETIYPHPPQKKIESARNVVVKLIEKYSVELIAIGNGTASRETEQFIAEIIKTNNLKCSYLIVSEAGASVYSASKIAKEEFPDLEASQRGNISIARRVLDPLAELVKIDPKSIGVGLYQHDVNQRELQKNLSQVVESCVNFVGVDLNTASAALLTHISGLNKSLANRLVKRREGKGAYKNREELHAVPGMGEKIFEQSAGFLKIPGSQNPLDNTAIHPESYDATVKLFQMCDVPLEEMKSAWNKIRKVIDKSGEEKIASEIGVGVPTLIDILENIQKPGRDPREEMPKPILRSDVLKLSDLSEGMRVKGTVRNVVDFGAFVDIGIKEDGLLHISQMADKFVKNPLDIVKVGDIIDVTIISIDSQRGRIGLSMKGE